VSERIVPFDPAWPDLAERMAADILDAVPAIQTVHHIGSTAVLGLIAKPIIDLVGEARTLAGVEGAGDCLAGLGFEAMGEYGIAGRRYFRRTVGGVRTHHLHIFEIGSPTVLIHLAFRDYLRAHPERRAAYAAVKQAIVSGDLGGGAPYAQAKAAFAKALEHEATAWAGLRPSPTP